MSAINKKKAGPKSKRRDQSVSNESEINETKKEEDGAVSGEN